MATFVAMGDAWNSAAAVSSVAATSVPQSVLLRGAPNAERPRGFGASSTQSLVSGAVACVAAAALGSQRRTRRRAAAEDTAAEDAQDGLATQPTCGVCGTANASRWSRRKVGTTLAGLAGAAVSGQPAKAFEASGFGNPIDITFDSCSACASEGLQNCVNCKGTGQFKMLSQRPGEAAIQYQYVDCPDCYGVGQRVCERCLGTGLTGKQLRGFLRKPEYRQIRQVLSDQRLSVYNIKQYQAMVKQAVANPGKLPEGMEKPPEAAPFSLPSLPELPSLPSLPLP